MELCLCTMSESKHSVQRIIHSNVDYSGMAKHTDDQLISLERLDVLIVLISGLSCLDEGSMTFCAEKYGLCRRTADATG